LLLTGCGRKATIATDRYRPGGDIGFSTKPTFDTKADPHLSDDLIDQVCSALRYAPPPTRRAKPAPLAGKRHQLLMRTARTAHAQKTVRQYAAFEIGLELVFDKLRQARTGF